MPSLSSYTPFESLLFFQSLAAFETRPTSFASISELLKSNPFIQQDATYDTNRLSPQALEQLYNDLINEEVQQSDGKALSQSQNGHGSDSPGNSKKRKIQHPSNIAHSTVVPNLVSRLYARYKERVTKEIQEEERRYRVIKDEIRGLQSIESGQATPTSAGPSGEPRETRQLEPAPGVRAPGGKAEDGPTAGQAVRGTTLGDRVDRIATEAVPKESGQTPQIQLPRPGGITPPVSTPAFQPPSNVAPQVPHPVATQAKVQVPALQPFPGHVNGAPSMSAQTTPQQISSPHPTARTDHAISKFQNGLPLDSTKVRGQTANVPIAPVAAAVPSSRPPSTGAALQPKPIAPDTAHRRPQEAHMMTLQMTPQFPRPQVPASQAAQSATFQQPWSPHPTPQTPQAHVSPYANGPYPNNHLSPQSVPQGPLAPYPYPDPNRVFQSPYASQTRPSPQTATSAQGAVRDSVPVTPMGAGRLAITTPSFSASLNRRPPRPSLDTAGTLTPWKSPGPILLEKSPGSPVQPRAEDVSPISERAPSPGSEIEKYENRLKVPSPKPKPPTRKKKSGPEARGTDAIGATRRRTTSATRGRGVGSPAASPIAMSTRSRSRGLSVASREDDTMTEATEAGQAAHPKIKREFPTTPSAFADEPETTAGTSRMDESFAGGGRKRKRGPDDSSVESNRLSVQYVQCTRNFPRTSAPIMNDIAAHKHASIFAKPLTERDAPGYKDFIYRPQDIKSIKSAIHQGSRGVAAATEAVNTPSADVESPGPGIGTPAKSNGLLLKKTVDLIPPKAIVNSSQLEKELTRMFANAVMFNPTPEQTFGPAFPMRSDVTSREGTQISEPEEGGIIKDTLEMCDDVEKAVSGWRAAERAVDDMGNNNHNGSNKNILALRRGSTSDINMDSADETR
ncbi:hypothetical protein AJ80_02430 [Polytolypa hystricis UAMH7299]|uniref:Bromo domain-containing protein n=1 Tax=Polytolypa hystricis (strain UAMH7299) TaxID=1447883 RepID=A0A2B7YPA0_POLH7|nr:hypothetical protein AJ80_02430 [Polytolypa hystricis UAMH7299]